MKKIIQITLIIFFFSNPIYAKNQYLQEGINLFKNKKFKQAQFKFEKDIVFNPRSELSYLYLSKIFKNLDKKELQEQNLNTVILLNPKNEEAIFNLAKLKLENSDYKKSKELNTRLHSVCINFCGESKKLEIEIDILSKK
jgi:tetratricopeptide (TPR) repeat protein